MKIALKRYLRFREKETHVSQCILNILNNRSEWGENYILTSFYTEKVLSGIYY